MPKNTRKTTGWNGVRRVLGAWDKPALLGLIKDLYAASEIGRDLVDSRCRPGESDDAILEKYRARIVRPFYPARGDGQLKLGEARRAVRENRKATGSIPGTAELLMTYVETAYASPANSATSTSDSTTASNRRSTSSGGHFWA